MEHKRNLTVKNSGTLLTKYSAAIEQAPATLPDLFKELDKHPSIARLKREAGEKVTLALIVKGIYDIIEGLPNELTEASIKRLAQFIMQEHKHLRPAEFKIIGNRLLRKEIYGKVTINTIAREIDRYWAERLDFAEEQQIAQASQHKADVIHGDIHKIYEDMRKQRQQEPRQTTGERLRKKIEITVKVKWKGKEKELTEAQLYEWAQRLYKTDPTADPLLITHNGTEKLKKIIPPKNE